MKDSVLRDYHASRDFAGKAFRSSCYAPFISLFFDTQGNVQACCQNVKYPLGNIAHDRLVDIWQGKKVETLRKALKKDNFAAGCQFCEWQISVGNYGGVYTRNFEQFPVSDVSPEWPVMMEFSISNTCNLECVMCKGEFSSLIRSNREKLPPMPKAYGEPFFAELRQFLPHLRYCKFLGGEPFLARESYHIWDMMMEDRLRIPCHVTTNGTQYNDRVAQVLERVPISFSVSVDGMTKETVESIRVNAPFEAVMENFRRFHAYARRQGTYIGLTYCLMRQNWHEFGDFLLFADDWDCEVVVNLVREPPGCSLYTLPLKELARIADALERQGAQIRRRLGRNRGVWDEHVGGLRRRVERREDSTRAPFETPLALVVLDTKSRLAVPEAQRIDVTRAGTVLDHWSAAAERRQLTTDQDDRLEDLSAGHQDVFGVPWGEVRGRLYEDLIERLRDRYGEDRVDTLEQSGHYVDRVHEFQAPDGGLYCLRTISVPRLSVFGLPEGAVTLSAAVWVSPGASTLTAAEAAERLGHWAGEAPLVELEVDRRGHFVGGSGGGWPALGIDPVEWRGRPLEEWFYPLRGRFGEERAVERWDQGLNHFDRVVRFRTPTGPAHGRMIAQRRFDPQGHPVGWRVLLGMVVIERERQPLTAAQARQRLAEWAPQGQIVELDLDFRGRIERAEGHLPPRWPLALDEVSGKSLGELGVLLGERVGAAHQLDLRKTGYVTDRVWSFATESGPWMVRSLRIPRFAESGKFVGWQMLVALSEIVAARAGEDPATWAAELRRWSGHGEVLRLDSDRDEIVRQVSGRLAADDADAEAAWVGRRHGEVPVLLAEHLGRQSVWELAVRADRTVAILQYDGPAGPLFVRGVNLPRFAADGTWLGYVVLLALKRLDPRAAAAAVETAQSTLATWGPGALRWELECDPKRVVQTVAGPATTPWGQAIRGAIGQPLAVLSERLASLGGSAAVVASRREIDREDYTLEYRQGLEPGRLRSIVLPRFDSAGAWHGSRVLLAWLPWSSAGLASAREAALGELSLWAPAGPSLDVTTDAAETITALEGSLIPNLASSEPLAGRSRDALLIALRATWGDERIFSESRDAWRDDCTLEFAGPRGPAYLRVVSLPRLDAAGHWQGREHLGRLLVPDRSSVARREAEAAAELARWAPTGALLEGHADATGRVVAWDAPPGATVTWLEEACLGRTLADLAAQGPLPHAQAELRHDQLDYFRRDQVWEVGAPAGPWAVRWQWFPEFIGDTCRGWRIWARAARLCDCPLPNDEALSAELLAWSTSRDALRLLVAPDDRIVESTGSLAALGGAEAGEWLGQPGSLVATRTEELWGPGRVYDVVERAGYSDRIQYHVGPRGPVFVRSVRRRRRTPQTGLPDQAVDWAVAVVADDPGRPSAAASEAPLAQETPGVWRLSLVSDAAGRVTQVAAEPSDAFGGREAALHGQDESNLWPWLTRLFGPAELLARNWTRYLLDEVSRAELAGRCTRVRRIRQARFDDGGHWLGWRETIVVAPLDEPIVAAADRAAEERLRDWAPAGVELVLASDAAGKIVAAEGAALELLEVSAAELRGQTLDRLSQLYAERLGAPRPTGLERTALVEDRGLEFSGPRGPLYCRALSYPDPTQPTLLVRHRARFLSLADAPGRATEDDALRALTEWSPEVVVWRLDTDPARVIVGDEPPPVDPLELRRENPTGKTWAQLCAAWTARWGESRVVYQDRQPDREEELRELPTDRGPVELRSFAVLRFDAGGRALGWRRLVGIVAVTRESRQATPESIEAQARDWAGGGPLLRIGTDRRLRVLSAVLSDPAADLPCGELVGHSVEELPGRLSARWGAWRPFHTVRTSDLSDNTLSFPEAATPRQIRGLQVPDFDASGRWVGYQVRAALVALPPLAARMTPAQGDELKRAWDEAADQTWLFANTLGVAQHVDRDPRTWTGLDWPNIIGRPWLRGLRDELVSRAGASTVQETWRGNVLEGVYRVPTAAGLEEVRVLAEPRAGDDGSWIGWVVLILSRRVSTAEVGPIASDSS